jgi:membrane fusion protein (multidrug efflux system)
LKGNISRVYPQLDERMRTRTVEVALSDPVELIPGMFARIQVILDSIHDAVIVPVEAVQITPGGEKTAYVFQDGKALRRKVQTGIEETNQIQILQGIQPGEQVIVMGNEKLKDGSPVRAIEGKQS